MSLFGLTSLETTMETGQLSNKCLSSAASWGLLSPVSPTQGSVLLTITRQRATPQCCATNKQEKVWENIIFVHDYKPSRTPRNCFRPYLIDRCSELASLNKYTKYFLYNSGTPQRAKRVLCK